MSPSPIRDAFSTVWHTPSLWLAEVAWRWAFGGAAWVLVVLTLGAWLNALPVSRVDRVLLASGSPDLIGRALQHIFAGSVAVLLRACAVLLPGLVLLWTVAASVGRAAMLRTLMPESNARWRSLVPVTFLRAMVTVAAMLCGLAGLILFVRVAAPALPAQGRPFAASVILLTLTLCVVCCWWVVHSFLTVAPSYAAVIRSTSAALTATFANAREYTGKWFGIASAFAALHAGLFVVFSGIATSILSTAGAMPRLFTLCAAMVTTMVYFALVDGIAVLRFAAYTRIASEVRASAIPKHNEAVVCQPV